MGLPFFPLVFSQSSFYTTVHLNRSWSSSWPAFELYKIEEFDYSGDRKQWCNIGKTVKTIVTLFYCIGIC